ncbi:MAG TPA: SLC13 family permease [Candidatus Acidoferrales bacterium]|jgi:Na+/H+ antiporter NhaD/arsenite permease-like protein|nr:SLC13 family permease [Candidatus Acidoferrales bacterium]
MGKTTIILIIFGITYLGIAMGRIPGLKLNRPGIALLGAIAMMIFGGVTTSAAVSYINWPTIFLLFGFFVISAQLRLSGFYDVVAANLASQLTHPGRFLFILMLVSGGLSAFLNNDVVCFVFTPITAVALLRKQLNPIPFLIALAISSNIGAGATLIGNPQNMMIAQVAHLNFGQYLLWSITPVIFALVAAYAIIWFLSQKNLRAAPSTQNESPQQTYPYNNIHTIKGFIILAVVIALFFTSLPKEVIALAAAGIHLASTKFKTNDLLGLVDWTILVLFLGLFVVTGAFQSTGCGAQAVHWLAQSGINLNTTANLVVTTAALSNLIGNSGAVMLLLKVLDLGQHSVPFILALCNSFAGNLMLIGALSSIIMAQQAREMGIKIGFWDFARLGIPVTLVSLAGLFVWAILVK